MPTSGQGSGTGGSSSDAKGAKLANSPATSASQSGDAQQATRDRQAAAAKVVSKATVDPIAQAAALRMEGVQPGAGSAAGIAAAGSPGGEETAGDQPAEAGSEEIQPAVITPSGSLTAQMVGSPSGPVPVGAFADHAAAQKAADQALLDAHSHVQRGLRGHRRLTRELLATMPRASIRAVAQDRGYDLGEAGRRVSIENFLKAQEDDDLLMDDDEVAEALRPAAVPVTGVTPAAATGAGAPGVAPGRTTDAEKAVREALDSDEPPEPVKIEDSK